MALIKQSAATNVLNFFMTDSADHISGKTGLAPTVIISKNGAAFGAPAGAVSEVANGWYKVAANATDSNTLGEIALHATGTGADPFDGIVAEIVAFDPQDATRFGLSALPNAAAQAAGGLYTRGTGAGQINQTNNGEIDANVTHINNVITTPVTTIKAVQGLTTADTITAYTGNTPQTGDNYVRIGAPAGASVSADIAAVKTDTAAIKTRTDSLTFTGAGKVDASVRDWIGGTIPAVNVTGVPIVDLKYTLGTISPATAGSVRADAVTGAVGSVTGLTASDVGAIKTQTDKLAFSVANQIDANVLSITGAQPASVIQTQSQLALISTSASDYTGQDNIMGTVYDGLAKALTEPGQTNPPVSTNLPAKVAYLYKAWRNRSTQTNTEYDLYNDDATTVGQKATVSDDGTTYTKGEVATGP